MALAQAKPSNVLFSSLYMMKHRKLIIEWIFVLEEARKVFNKKGFL